ncbi:hypothetical protein LZ30DRAFT_687656 [Colletotrichum cereale]|nr:hypothetical protein LZ30DRAFT_687656 [Colletotrichum cereale]
MGTYLVNHLSRSHAREERCHAVVNSVLWTLVSAALRCAVLALLCSAHLMSPSKLWEAPVSHVGKRRLRSARTALRAPWFKLCFPRPWLPLPFGVPRTGRSLAAPEADITTPSADADTHLVLPLNTGRRQDDGPPPPTWAIALFSLSGCVCRGLLVPIRRDRAHGPL